MTQNFEDRARQNSSLIEERFEAMSVYQVLPRLTDRAIDNWLDPHFVALGHAPFRQNKLLLFFPGSYGKPGRQLLFLQEAAALGYHVINLSYPNSWTVAEICEDCQDADCHEKIRLDILDGRQRSNQITVSPANAIINRLVKLLHYLDQQQPQENWRQYLDEDLPKWESFIVAGHSQGGGHAAIIAKDHLVARVIMMASPADFRPVFRSLAPWLAADHVTPADRYYGFIHLKDPGFARVQQAWKMLGMNAFGSPVNVDRQAIPYNHSHCLITATTPGRPGKYHGSVVNDLQTPKLLDNKPKFKQVWRYLCSA